MMKSLKICVLTMGLLALSVPLLAHHGNAAFDSGKKVTLIAFFRWMRRTLAET